jgi:ATP-binding cassette subfamily F protein 3
LDEPTNHLDMESCDALLAALDAFSGAVVLVTHNELFLHALAQKLIVFQGDGPFVFDGDYRCFLEKIGWENENQPDRIDSPSGMNSGKTLKEKKPPMKKAEKKRIRSQLIAEKGKVLNPLKKQIKGLENQIDHDEKELAELNRALLDASKENNGAEIADLSRSIHQQRTTIDRLFDELERLMSRYEKKQAFFDHELNSTA